MFKLKSEYTPCGDQQKAIADLVSGIEAGARFQTLLGVTGSGKTFTMAHVIAKVKKPTLILAPNKTLAAQLYAEFRSFFPESAVEYFVSYYDYYQPEAYIPRTDVYIEKDSAINEEIDKLRHAATHALLTRQDVIIVASVSCIYGLGSPEAYNGMLIDVQRGMNCDRKEIINRLVEIQYERNDCDFHRGTFRARGDTLDIFPVYEESEAVRISFFDDVIDQISVIDPLKGNVIKKTDRVAVYPGSHFVTPEGTRQQAVEEIKKDLKDRIQYFHEHNMPLEKQRIEQRTLYDLEMIEEIGFCKGIENYSRYFDGRKEGEPPPTLLKYMSGSFTVDRAREHSSQNGGIQPRQSQVGNLFPRDFLLFIDESHISVPQIGGMYKGDRSRKQTLVDYGFRLKSALDNRPLTFEEFEASLDYTIFVSATPGDYEFKKSAGVVVEQVIRPTGLVDPVVEVRPVAHQVDDLINEVKKTVAGGERVLVTTLTKRMAENLSKYFAELDIRCRYLHSDIKTLERFEILRDLRKGVFDVLVGINLLREGLDLPEVSLVAILDADKEGFLRSERSLVQTFGRAARNINGRVIAYSDTMTGSLKRAIAETERRRKIQMAYNKEHGLTPKSIIKAIREGIHQTVEADYVDVDTVLDLPKAINVRDIPKMIVKLRKEMLKCSQYMDFEKAALIRDEIKKLREVELCLGGDV
ncbi:MAG: excinuclease ABC subunit UvrB [Deltaproteobacteria bacterium]|nr:excinuclease ABC subunit UvrB [Deltaproteobacteria bacterium]